MSAGLISLKSTIEGGTKFVGVFESSQPLGIISGLKKSEALISKKTEDNNISADHFSKEKFT